MVGEGPGMPLVVLCHRSRRSRPVTGWPRRRGFPLAANLAGGIDARAKAVDPDLPLC